MLNLGLDAGDATGLAELPQFLNDWLAGDRTDLDASLTRFVGARGDDLPQLRRPSSFPTRTRLNSRPG